MNYLTLDLVKQHLNIDADFEDDDNLITIYCDAAEEALASHLDCPLLNYENSEGKIPMPLIQAMLLLVGTWYDNRESISYGSVNKVPHCFEYLIGLYQSYRKKYFDNDFNEIENISSTCL